jgi:hypothetical protein
MTLGAACSEDNTGPCRERLTAGIPTDCDESCFAACWDGWCYDENGGCHFTGHCGCWASPWPPSLCEPTRYSCDTAVLLQPGNRAAVHSDPCGVGLNSFWYEGPIVADSPPTVDPCPAEDPCCRTLSYPIGFAVPIDGTDRFIPLDTSELAGTGWGCTGTNCAVTCVPAAGSLVQVHVRWLEAPESTSYDPIPERFVVEEICSSGSP